MINLKIDPEFQSQIPPLTDDEFTSRSGALPSRKILVNALARNTRTNIPFFMIFFLSHIMLSNSSFPHIAPEMPAAIIIIATTRRSFFCMIAS